MTNFAIVATVAAIIQSLLLVAVAVSQIRQRVIARQADIQRLSIKIEQLRKEQHAARDELERISRKLAA